MTTVTVHTEEGLADVARVILANLNQGGGARCITLQGDLGAGKTAFTKALAKELGIQEHITSPTFVIMKSYAVTKHPWITTLTHIDAYRIDDEDELRVLGFESLCGDPTRLLCIEWPERIPHALPEGALAITITIGDHNERIITYGA